MCDSLESRLMELDGMLKRSLLVIKLCTNMVAKQQVTKIQLTIEGEVLRSCLLTPERAEPRPSFSSARK